MSVIDCEQNTDEWLEARRGKVTASRISDVMAKGRGSAPSRTRANYEAQLIAERLTGTVAESFTSPAMAWGTEHEPKAVLTYELMHDIEALKVGFVDHPAIEMSGASPDRFVGDDGLLEIKCPNTATHLDTLLGKSIDGGYIKQMQWQMACTGRQWCDFISFDPRLPAEMQLHIVRVDRDPVFIAATEAAVREFLSDLDIKLTTLTSRYMLENAA